MPRSRSHGALCRQSQSRLCRFFEHMEPFLLPVLKILFVPCAPLPGLRFLKIYHAAKQISWCLMPAKSISSMSVFRAYGAFPPARFENPLPALCSSSRATVSENISCREADLMVPYAGKVNLVYVGFSSIWSLSSCPF